MPSYWVLDGFLPDEEHAALLAHALALGDADFARGMVNAAGEDRHEEKRTSRVSRSGLGALKAAFREAVRARLPQVFEALGVESFEPSAIEVELAAHGDGHFFKPHTDTFIARSLLGTTDRVLTLVYYFYRQPRRFDGGELAIYPFAPGEPVLIEPRDNRLVALPAFAVHEVRPVSCPGCTFEDSRFAVTTWVHRARPPGQ